MDLIFILIIAALCAGFVFFAYRAATYRDAFETSERELRLTRAALGASQKARRTQHELLIHPGIGLTDDELRIMKAMSDGESVRPMAAIADDAGVSEARVRNTVRWLQDRGYATFGTIADGMTGKANGRGYWLTPLGLRAREI